jgi:hypothetical protein
MSPPRNQPEALRPDELAGRLDQQILFAVDSEGPVLGRPARPGQEMAGVPSSPRPPIEAEAARPIEPVRQRLQSRRQTVVQEVRHAGMDYILEVSLRPETGQPAEVFISAKPGVTPVATDHALLQDAATVVSLALQCGITAEAMRAIVGQSDEGYASVLGTVLAKLCRED